MRFRTNVDDWVACDAAHRLRFEMAADGGLTPYLHVRADLWAKVTRALYYDLVDIGEEREVDGQEMFGVVSVGRIFPDGRCGAGEGGALNEQMLKIAPAVSAAEFFNRARARLTFDVPPGLVDPNIVPPSGDPGTDRMLEIIAREQPVRPAAVLIAVVEHREPTVLLTQRSADLNEHAGQIAFPGGKIDATDKSPLDAALREAGGGGRSRPRLHRSDRLSRSLRHRLRFSHPADGGAGEAGLQAAINHSEVDDAFEVPLAFLMNPANHQIHSKEFRGMERSYYAMPYAERYIWGATAGMLRVLYERIYLP